jgi:pimeloyl-ACP methyl ester carboxylesterase
MPELRHRDLTIHYEVDGPAGGPVYVMVNGLTQYVALWQTYRQLLVPQGFRVITFDLLGQGDSDKPALFIGQADQVEMVRVLIESLAPGPAKIFLAGISFGGVIALRYAIEHGDRLTGLCVMSTFAELSPQLLLLGTALRNGLVLGGVGYLQDLLLPMNVSDAWLAARLDKMDAVKRPGWLVNDLYALQNLMESFLDFQPLTPDLPRISVPTMILNGEFDFLTPRHLHEPIRTGIPDSALVLIPRGYHAFTLEMPELTAWLLTDFAAQVRDGSWKGAQSVWIAPEHAGGTLQSFPARYDHLRSIPVRRTGPQA